MQWVWVALDADTRRVVAMVVGDRSEFTARCLWDALPVEYRDEAVVWTDFLAAYRAAVPEERHAAAGKLVLDGEYDRVCIWQIKIRRRLGGEEPSSRRPGWKLTTAE